MVNHGSPLGSCNIEFQVFIMPYTQPVAGYRFKYHFGFQLPLEIRAFRSIVTANGLRLLALYPSAHVGFVADVCES